MALALPHVLGMSRPTHRGLFPSHLGIEHALSRIGPSTLIDRGQSVVELSKARFSKLKTDVDANCFTHVRELVEVRNQPPCASLGMEYVFIEHELNHSPAHLAAFASVNEMSDADRPPSLTILVDRFAVALVRRELRSENVTIVHVIHYGEIVAVIGGVSVLVMVVFVGPGAGSVVWVVSTLPRFERSHAAYIVTAPR